MAGINAAFRARESLRPPSARVLEDPWAKWFVEHDARVQMVRFGRFLVPALARMVSELQTIHCVRHRCIDELVLHAIEVDGCTQVVAVGAGYDMRAYRFADRSPHVVWFEVDHPSILARKQRGLDRARRDAAPHLERVRRLAITRLQGTLVLDLQRFGLDPSQPTCFVLEGLVHYLSPTQFEALLATFGSFPGRCRLVFSFIRSDVYLGAPGLFVSLVKLLREVPRLHFSPRDLATLCARHGLDSFRSWSGGEQVQEFAPAAHGRAIGLSQDVAVVGKEVGGRTACGLPL